jgi:GNAT superfamily N-acetyltransferase
VASKSRPSDAASGVECITAEELGVDDAWWRIYEGAFASNEREPRSVILDSVARGVGVALRVRRQETTFGLATIHLLRQPAAVFLVYLAVAPGERSRGIGGELLERAWESGAERLRAEGLEPLGLIWEVDPPETTAGDADARLRRVAFFERHGGQLLDPPYLQPPVDGISTVPMRLMFRPAAGGGTPSADVVNDLVRAIYFEKYGGANGIDRSLLEDLLRGR